MLDTLSSSTATKERLLQQARQIIAAPWTCDVIPGDTDDSIESWTLRAHIGIFMLQLWQPGSAARPGMASPSMIFTVGSNSDGLGGIMLLFGSYETIDAALQLAVAKLREIATAALAPLRA